eukprot:TRINITY_DN7675_c0_g1_i1.p2 TRINITY_DN7675_c0_g1~~TRINITY_DN7675_c0_g1_i1.p2  ORF type:complete len:155 (-),score=33.82 TRINITY_DN7675_c0_g1_i1:206-670(-)
MDPCESLEFAIVRETKEESGVVIDVHSVRYHSSQPWPFLGGQIMFGAHAIAEGPKEIFRKRADEGVSEWQHRGITVDTTEMEDVAWFTKEEAASAVEESKKNISQQVRQWTTKPNTETPTHTVGFVRVPPPFAIAHHLIKSWVDGEISLAPSQK